MKQKNRLRFSFKKNFIQEKAVCVPIIGISLKRNDLHRERWDFFKQEFPAIWNMRKTQSLLYRFYLDFIKTIQQVFLFKKNGQNCESQKKITLLFDLI